MLKILSTNNPALFFVAVFLSFSLHVFALFSITDFTYLLNHQEPIANFIFVPILSWGVFAPMVLIFGGFIVQVIGAWLLNNLVNNQKLSTKKSYLVATLFVLVSSFSVQWLVLSPQLICLFLAILSIQRVFVLSKQEKMVSPLFDIGFFYALAVLTYFPSVIFFLFIFPALYSVRPFAVVEFLRVLLGLITPFFVAVAICFINDRLNGLDAAILNTSHVHFLTTAILTQANLLVGIPILLWWVGSAFVFSIFPFSISIKTRKMIGIVILLSVFLTLALLVPTAYTHLAFLPITIVVSLLLGIAFLEAKRDLIPNVIFALLFLTTVVSLFFST